MPTLMKHQVETAEFLKHKPAIMLAFEMGTGKSAIAAVTLAHDIAIGKAPKGAVIISPASLLYNWKRELSIWAPGLTVSIEGEKSKPADRKAQVIISSYERMGKVQSQMHERGVFVFDEAQYLCHLQAKRTELAHKIVRDAGTRRLLLMTGTPMSTRVSDLYSLLCLLDLVDNHGFRKGFRTQAQFSETFCHVQAIQLPHMRFPIKKYSGLKNLDYLRPWLYKWWMRCTLKEVVDLPPITIERLAAPDLDAAVAKALDVAYQKHCNGIETEEHKFGDMVGEHISTAKANSALAKAPHTAEFVTDMLLAGEGPILVFSDHVAAATDIYKCLSRGRGDRMNEERQEYGKKNFGLITGATSPAKRSNLVDAFQRGEVDAIVATIGALQTGFTLTRGNICVVNDKNWKPSANKQAYGRMHRISQTRPVFIYEVVAGSIDEKIYEDLAQKEETINAVMGC